MKNKKILTGISIATQIGILSFCLCVFSLFGIQYYNIHTSEEIKNKEHLKQILKQEKAKLGIEDKVINVEYVDWACYSMKEFNGEYSIFLDQDSRKIKILKHELYHISDGHCDMKESSITYFLYQEPKAILYTAGLIKPR